MTHLTVERVFPACTCDDVEVLELSALVELGFDQFEASRLLWGTRPAALGIELARARLWAREHVRQGFRQAFPWLQLPPPTGEAGA